MQISIIGAGNVATHLALALKKAGHHIVHIYNRSDDAGQELARVVGAKFTSDLTLKDDAEVYLIAVKDDAIEQVASQLKVGDKIIAHTSGTQTKDLLKDSSSRFGIFYPLQTMNRTARVDFKDVPVLIEANDHATGTELRHLAQSISRNIHHVDEEQRQWVHVAAVIANNFTNHLLTLSDGLLREHSMSLEILKPLIFSFIENLKHRSPEELQTGPAIRGDEKTIEKHLQLLGNDQRLAEIYRILSDSIMERHKKPQS